MVATQRKVTAETLREKFSATDELVWIPASKEDFWELIELPEFKIEYSKGQIVGNMSYATENHETIVANLIALLHNALVTEGYKILGSNRPVFVEDCDEIFEPDIHTVFGKTEIHQYAVTKTATMNPSVIVEVASKTTVNFDWNTKLPCYKTIPSLQHIIYVEQNKPYIEVFTRTKKPNQWLNEVCNDSSQKFKVFGKTIALKSIYQGVIFNM
jgi:Uma2 family endonuclease